MDEGEMCLGFMLILVLSSPLIPQGMGVYGTDWVSTTSCEELDNKPSCCNSTSNHSNVNDSCNGGFTLYDLHGDVFWMQMVALIILCTPVNCGLTDLGFAMCYKNYEAGPCIIIGGLSFLLYPVAGILNFIGCMIIVGVYSGQTFGSSFYYCLGVGLGVTCLTIILTSVICCKKHKAKPQTTDSRVVIFLYIVNIQYQFIHWSESE